MRVFVLDEMISHLNSRFSEIQCNAMMVSSIVPDVFMTNCESDTATMALVEDIAKYYADDLPSPATLQQELHIWHSKWKCVEKLTSKYTIRHTSCHKKGYVPNHSYSSVHISALCQLPPVNVNAVLVCFTTS